MSDGSTASVLILLLPLALIGFLLFSSSRRRRQMEQFQSSITIGDEIITTAGIYGTVVALDPVIAQVEVAQGVVVRLDRRAVGMRAQDRPAPPSA